MRPILKLSVVAVLVGILGGFSGMTLALLLRNVQRIAYGALISARNDEPSFLAMVSGASPGHRLFAMLLCGLVAGLGWFVVYHFGRPLVSIRQAVQEPIKPVPTLETIGHALLQILTVAMGSPLGREVAPRELGALAATHVARIFRLSVEDRRIMIACGAGAGLAAVYNVPLAGALFTLEVLLGSFSLDAVVPAIATSVIATVVSWIGLGDRSQYEVPAMDVSAPLVIFSILLGPLFGYAGVWYSRLATMARSRTHRDWRLIPMCLLVFGLIGVAAMRFPELLGNGRGPTRLAFESEIALWLGLALILLKLLATTASLYAGAEGGLLTPGLTIGALMATAIGTVWNWCGAEVRPGAFAVVGAAAFLSSSMAMPLTAIALVVEFTRLDQDFLIPMLCAVAGAVTVRRAMQN